MLTETPKILPGYCRDVLLKVLQEFFLGTSLINVFLYFYPRFNRLPKTFYTNFLQQILRWHQELLHGILHGSNWISSARIVHIIPLDFQTQNSSRGNRFFQKLLQGTPLETSITPLEIILGFF